MTLMTSLSQPSETIASTEEQDRLVLADRDVGYEVDTEDRPVEDIR